MQYVDGRLVRDGDRYSEKASVYMVNLVTGSYTLLEEFDSVAAADIFVRGNIGAVESPMTLLSYNDTLVPIGAKVASLVSFVQTGHF